ncbi:MAG: peptidoglycan-binding domain-containing protein [Vulcanimicrobiaceae bacterium]
MKHLYKHFALASALLLGVAFGAVLTPPPALAAAPASATSSMSGMSGGMKNDMMKMMGNKTWVKHVQEALISHGAHIPTDGICGKKTIDAIRAFQKTQGLKVTGMPDPETLKALDINH